MTTPRTYYTYRLPNGEMVSSIVNIVDTDADDLVLVWEGPGIYRQVKARLLTLVEQHIFRED